jgi:hypothetical protein
MNLQRGSHRCGKLSLVKVIPEHRRNISRREADGSGEMIVIAQNPVRGIEAGPAGTGKINFSPGVERSSSTILPFPKLA